MRKKFFWLAIYFTLLSLCLLSGCMNEEGGSKISVSGSMEMQHTSGRSF